MVLVDHRERNQKFRETGELKHLHRNEFEKAFFAYDAANFGSKDLAKRTISEKILKDRDYEIARNRKYDGYLRALASMVYKFLMKKRECKWTIIRRIGLSEMESLFSKNQNVKYLLCVIDVFTKHARVNRLKDKKGKTVLNAFIEIINESNNKSNTIWVGQGREFYNKFGQEWLHSNYILMYSTHIDGKSVIAETFIKTLKAKIFKNMTANNSKSYLSYLNKLVDHSINKKTY